METGQVGGADWRLRLTCTSQVWNSAPDTGWLPPPSECRRVCPPLPGSTLLLAGGCCGRWILLAPWTRCTVTVKSPYPPWALWSDWSWGDRRKTNSFMQCDTFQAKEWKRFLFIYLNIFIKKKCLHFQTKCITMFLIVEYIHYILYVANQNTTNCMYFLPKQNMTILLFSYNNLNNLRATISAFKMFISGSGI